MINRRCLHGAGLGAMWAGVAGLASCATPAAPVRWYRLPAEPPVGEARPAATTGASPKPGADPGAAAAERTGIGGAGGGASRLVVTPPRWQLAPSLPMPELLERDTLLYEEGTTHLRVLHGHRWAEPLRDALPRLVRLDLGRWAPGLWAGPATVRWPGAGTLQLELLGLLGSLPRRQVALLARWVMTPPPPERGQPASLGPLPQGGQAELVVPWTDGAPQSLVLAQRIAFWRLAQRVALSLSEA